ncbi:MAG TPA: metallophosphoesterase [Nitrososphaeraceae archaeon]|nr:metallophosphoesterase [Nitrososphaeraceae archaeon]
MILDFTSVSAVNNDDGFFSVNPEDYYNTEDSEEESQVSNQLSDEKNNSPDKDALKKLSSHSTTTTKTVDRHPFNIAVTADWGCEEDTKKTVANIQKKNPELVISAGDASYHKSSECWFDIIKPLKSKMKIAMGDHEYSDTTGGAKGVINQYLKPLNLAKTYYSYDLNNAHFSFIDPFIDYGPNSVQYQFIENDLKTASTNPNIDWTFVVESTPIYTSPSQHPGNSTIRDIYHPLFERYSVDIVFTSDNHNYQRTFPLKYSGKDGDSSKPIIADSNQNSYYNTIIDDGNNDNNNKGIIYLITGTAGRSLYEIKEQAPFVAKQDDKHFGFLNIDINGKTLKGTFYANELQLPPYHYVNYQSNIIDEFTISKTTKTDSNRGLDL